VATEVGPRGGGCWAAAPPNPPRSQIRKADPVDRIASEVLLDLPFSPISH